MHFLGQPRTNSFSLAARGAGRRRPARREPLTRPALALRSPKIVIWAQEIFPIVIYNRKYSWGPKNSCWGSRPRGGDESGRIRGVTVCKRTIQLDCNVLLRTGAITHYQVFHGAVGAGGHALARHAVHCSSPINYAERLRGMIVSISLGAQTLPSTERIAPTTPAATSAVALRLTQISPRRRRSD